MAEDEEPVNHDEIPQETGESSASPALSSIRKAQTIDVTVLALYLAGAAYVFSRIRIAFCHFNSGRFYRY